jgi:hypothetical protein
MGIIFVPIIFAALVFNLKRMVKVFPGVGFKTHPKHNQGRSVDGNLKEA